MARLLTMSNQPLPINLTLIAGSPYPLKISGLGSDKRHVVLMCSSSVVSVVVNANERNVKQTLRLEPDTNVRAVIRATLSAYLASKPTQKDGITASVTLTIEPQMAFPPESSELGIVTRMLLAESTTPGDPDFVVEESLESMQWIRHVLLNRLKFGPQYFGTGKKATTIAELIKAPNQVKGFESYPGIAKDQATVINAGFALQIHRPKSFAMLATWPRAPNRERIRAQRACMRGARRTQLLPVRTSSSARARVPGFLHTDRIVPSRSAAAKDSQVRAKQMGGTMRSRIGLLFSEALMIAALMTAIAACTADSFPAEFDEKPVKRFVAAQNEYYGPVEPALEQLVLSDNKNERASQFCVVGYAYAGKTVNVWVHWANEERLILWRGNSDPELREQGLTMSKRNLKLGEDTVETADDIKGSTYLVTRAWWQAVAKDCAAHGQRYAVEPFSAADK
jgi:hypothetical protein